jgi:hypothetical protein
MVLATGFAPPTLPVNVKLVGVSPTAGVVLPEVTVRVTRTDFVVAPVPLTVTVPVNVPTASPERLTLALTVPALVPVEGLTVNQLAFSLADQLRVPPPVFAMLIAWAAGFAPPMLPVKVTLVGLSPIAGVVLPLAVTAIVIGIT